MAYSFGPWDDALDSLSLNYTDGVPVRISEPFRCDYDFSQVDEILRKTTPNVLLDDVGYDCELERKVLGEYEKHKEEREERKRVREEKLRKYEERKKEELELKRIEEEEKALEDERRRLEEIEAENLKLENERRQQEEEAESKRLEQEAQLKLLQAQADEQAAAEEALNTDSPEDTGENASPTNTNENNEPSIEPIEENSDNKANASATSSFPELTKEINVIGTQSNTPTNVVINFSEFEREADPFADLELKTINDLEELQSISQSVSQQQQHQQQQLHHPAQHQIMTNHQQSTLSSLHGFTPGGVLNSIPAYTPPYSVAGYTSNYQAPYQFSFPNPPPGVPPSTHPNPPPGVPPSTHLMGASGSTPSTPPIHGQMYMGTPALIPPSNQSDPRNPYAFSPPGLYNPYQPRLTQPPVTRPEPPTRTEKLKDHDNDPPPGELKPSRSLGDMINELQREAKIVQEAKRKSSRTPPLRPNSTSTGMENWSPWPDLESSSVNGTTQPDPLEGLEAPEVEVCQQLHEMGFPLSRLAVGVKAVGRDTQKLINFCLVVDQLVEDGHEPGAAEKAASLHDADVEASKKHLETFSKLHEIGFPSKDIHEALVQQKGDYQAALEVLIS